MINTYAEKTVVALKYRMPTERMATIFIFGLNKLLVKRKLSTSVHFFQWGAVNPTKYTLYMHSGLEKQEETYRRRTLLILYEPIVLVFVISYSWVP
jgi:hypothetical protein